MFEGDVSGVAKKGFLRRIAISELIQRELNVLAALILHVGDLAISGTDASIAYLSDRLQMGTGRKFLRKTKIFIRALKLKRRLMNSPTMEIFQTELTLLRDRL